MQKGKRLLDKSAPTGVWRLVERPDRRMMAHTYELNLKSAVDLTNSFETIETRMDDGDFAPQPDHTTGRAAFRIRWLNPATSVGGKD